MEDKTIKIIIVLGVLFAICTFTSSFLLVISTIPKSAIIKDGNIILETRLGSPCTIPESEVTFQENPPIIPNLIRTNGTSFGRYHSGHFREKSGRIKYYLFLKGTGHRRSFTYNDEIYIVDFD